LSSGRVARDSLKWTWGSGGATSAAELGDPASSDSYVLCLYDRAAGVAEIRFEKDVVASGDCSGAPCWEVANGRVSYKDARRTRSAVKLLQARAGESGRAKIKLIASGIALGPPRLPLQADPSVTIQLINRQTGACWQADYSTSERNEAGRFSAKSD